MNAALRRLREELAWLADAEKRASDPRTLRAEKTPAEVVFAQLDEIDRERAEIREAIEMLENQLGRPRSRPTEPLKLFEAAIYR